MLSPGHPLFTLALILIAGVSFGAVVRRLGLPTVTGQIVGGILLGPSVSGLISAEAIHDLRPLTHFALGLIAVAVGNHLNFKRLRNAYRRLLWLLVLEATLTPALVLGALYVGGTRDLGLGLMLATMAIATAPASVVAIVAECRARGVFTKTLIAAVALNNIACILLFEIARQIAREERLGWEGSLFSLFVQPFGQLLEPLLIGVGVGVALIFMTRKVARSDLLASASIIAILFTAGLSEVIGVSALLSCLFLGVTLANLTPDKDEIGHQVFRDFESAIFAVFFTLAGMELDFAYVIPAGALAALYVVGRILGKVGAATLAMTLSGATDNKRRYLGLALIPQAGVAIGLVLLVQNDPALSDIASLILAVGLTAVVVAEIIGPLTTRFAVVASGEAGKDRPRLIDFLHEEHILTDLGEVSYEAAVRRLADHLVTTHAVPADFDRSRFVRDVLDDKHPGAFYLGHGLAIPHARVEGPGPIVGVLGISPEGLSTPTSDGERVHCLVLLATPDDQADRHLEVIAAFAKAIGSDRNIQHELYLSRSAAHAYELLHAEDAEDFNYFLDDDDDDLDGERPVSSRPPSRSVVRAPADGG